jgi:GxxExxY protein
MSAPFCLELDARGISFETEKSIDVRYKTWVISGQRVDLVVEGVVLVAVKAVRKLLKLHERQVRSYLKTMSLRAALLLNFNTTLLKNGLQRIVAT